MDKDALVEAVAGKTARTGERLTREEVGRVVDALFGTVEHAGVIAESLKRGEQVTLIGFGGFHLEGSGPALRPGQALEEYLNGTVR
ncbi:DNA-binding protein HU [Streptomyces sp. S4.7]|uniref:HU family DNA-binding protein n=1 Tax=Streptomyces sp. S4.7 TaxID=2705439 RepID=UPI0013989101|nr:HU family DNA-binding protein [Streptomyces sp. S4.7]QHY93564.1 DNA-binding protein HU [Streptomyces sp. S4.7]